MYSFSSSSSQCKLLLPLLPACLPWVVLSFHFHRYGSLMLFAVGGWMFGCLAVVPTAHTEQNPFSACCECVYLAVGIFMVIRNPLFYAVADNIFFFLCSLFHCNRLEFKAYRIQMNTPSEVNVQHKAKRIRDYVLFYIILFFFFICVVAASAADIVAAADTTAITVIFGH